MRDSCLVLGLDRVSEGLGDAALLLFGELVEEGEDEGLVLGALGDGEVGVGA